LTDAETAGEEETAKPSHEEETVISPPEHIQNNFADAASK
jgi:hypothetical protein